MLATFNLDYRPFDGVIKIMGTSNQYITLNSKRKQILYRACYSQRQRIFFRVCEYMAGIIKINNTQPLDVSNLEKVMQPWMDAVCSKKFRSAVNHQPSVENDFVRSGKKAFLEGIGLSESKAISLEEDTSPTPSEELVTASEPEPVAEPVEPTTKTYTLPISSQKAVTLTIPIDLTKDEAELIANSSMEYLKALLLSQYKE